MLSSRVLRTLRRALHKPTHKYILRHFLSPAYECKEAWNLRLEDPRVKGIKPLDFYYELLRKYKKEGKIAAIDADLFFNALTTENSVKLLTEVDEGLCLLRNTPETVNTLPSTIHAVLRIFIEFGKYDDVIRLLSNPTKYGLFLDFYSANLLMNTLLKAQNYTGSARIASLLMLQEDFGPPLTRSLAFLSCLKFALSGEGSQPWVDYNPSTEPEEEVKVLVRYVRNPYFDDHFDLKNPTHIVGKTLAWLAMDLGEPYKTNSALLGWSLFEKWSELASHLDKATRSEIPVDAKLIALIEDQAKKCEEEETQQNLTQLINRLKKSGKAKDLNLEEMAAEEVRKLVAEVEGKDIKTQESLYASWIVERDNRVKEKLEEYRKLETLEKIEEKKRYLREKEEIIFFFENKDKIELKFPKALQEKSTEDLQSKGHLQKQVKDEEYHVPEIRRKDGIPK